MDSKMQQPNAASPLIKLGAGAYFGIASFCLQFINKALFTTYSFDYPMLVAFLQMAFMCPVCYMIGKPKIEWETIKGIYPLSIVGVLNTVTGLMGVGGLNVPMFIALRRFTIIITLGLEIWWYKKKHSKVVYGTISIMMAGTIIAALTDLAFNLRGYLAIFMNNLFTASYLVLIKNNQKAKELTTIDLLCYNSMISLPLLFSAAFFSGEIDRLPFYDRAGEIAFKGLLAGSSMLGLVINHAQFVCTRTNDPLMTSVVGQLKNIISTVAGAILFSDFVYNIYNIVGLTLSMIGSVAYALHSALSTQNQKGSIPAQIKQQSAGGKRHNGDSENLKSSKMENGSTGRGP